MAIPAGAELASEGLSLQLSIPSTKQQLAFSGGRIVNLPAVVGSHNLLNS
jgi:hypothetical protein